MFENTFKYSFCCLILHYLKINFHPHSFTGFRIRRELAGLWPCSSALALRSVQPGCAGMWHAGVGQARGIYMYMLLVITLLILLFCPLLREKRGSRMLSFEQFLKTTRYECCMYQNHCSSNTSQPLLLFHEIYIWSIKKLQYSIDLYLSSSIIFLLLSNSVQEPVPASFTEVKILSSQRECVVKVLSRVAVMWFLVGNYDLSLMGLKNVPLPKAENYTAL